jgi:hypothetical protein
MYTALKRGANEIGELKELDVTISHLGVSRKLEALNPLADERLTALAPEPGLWPE